MLRTMSSTTFATLTLLALFQHSALAQAPPGYTDTETIPASQMITTAGTTLPPSTYFTSALPDACTGTSASCPCLDGYACSEIADCHWKCLMTATSFPAASTTPASLSASVTSTITIASTITVIPILSNSPPASTAPPPSSSATLSFPTFSYAPTSGYGNYTMPSGSGQVGPVRTETITEFPTTCPVETRTREVWRRTTVTECPDVCPTNEGYIG